MKCYKTEVSGEKDPQRCLGGSWGSWGLSGPKSFRRQRAGAMASLDSLLSEMSEAQKEEVAVEMSRVSESDFDLWTAAMKESGEQAKQRR